MKFQNPNELNSLFGKVAAAATKLNKRNVPIEVKRIVPNGKNEKPFVVIIYHKKKIAFFSPDTHGAMSCDEIKKRIRNYIGVGKQPLSK